MKLAVFDIDGTLISQKNHSISDTTILALRKLKEKGANLAIASGRSFLAIDKRVMELNIFDWFICGNGTLVFDKNGKKIYVSESEMDVFRRQMEDAVMFDGVLQINYEKGMEILYGMDKMFQYSVHFLGKNGTEKLFSDKRKEGKPTNGKCFIPDGQLRYYENKYPELKFIPAQLDNYYDFVNKDCSKGQTLKRLMEYISVTKEEVIVFGDDYNDVEMLHEAGISVVMGNANDDVKAVADYVTTECDKDGIWNALMHFNII